VAIKSIYLFREESENENFSLTASRRWARLYPITGRSRSVFFRRLINTLAGVTDNGLLVAIPPHCLWRVKGEFSTGR
jgi:hypothetical protein